MKKNDIYRAQGGDSYSLFTKNGLKHNLCGPALKIGDTEYYYVDGISYTADEWTNYVSAYTAYERSPIVEKELYDKALSSADGIHVDCYNA